MYQEQGTVAVQALQKEDSRSILVCAPANCAHLHEHSHMRTRTYAHARSHVRCTIGELETTCHVHACTRMHTHVSACMRGMHTHMRIQQCVHDAAAPAAQFSFDADDSRLTCYREDDLMVVLALPGHFGRLHPTPSSSEQGPRSLDTSARPSTSSLTNHISRAVQRQIQKAK